MLTRRALVSAGAAFAAGAVSLGGAQAADDGVIVVPMQLSDERFWTFAWINRKGPYRLMLDTGSPRYFITPKIVEEAGLTYATSQNLRGVTGAAHAERSYAAGEVIIGGVLRDRDVVFSAARTDGDFIVGAMPLGLLLLRPTELDFAEGQMRIYESGGPSKSDYRRLDLTQPLEDVSMVGVGAARFKPPPRLIIPVQLDGQVFRLMIDTGDPSAITLFGRTVAQRGLWNKYPKWSEADGHGLEEAFKAKIVRLSALQIGDLTLNNPVVQLVDPQMIEADFGAEGLIGLETLRRMTWLIDAGSNTLAMKPNGAAGQAFRYNRSGMVLKRAEGRLVVVAAPPNTPAAKAGLAVGDLIDPPAGMSLGMFSHSLSGEPGVVLRFQAERDGKAFPVRIVLQDLI